MKKKQAKGWWAKSFGQRVLEVRLAQGMTQADLAKKTGLIQSTISDIERGPEPKLPTVRKLAKALKLNITDLIGE